MRRLSPQVRLLDASRQNRLARALRALPEERAFTLIKRLVAIETKVGLALANRVLISLSLVESLLAKGLLESNESTCRIWLEILGHRLGIDKTLAIIESLPDPDRKVAVRLLYWLPTVFKDDPTADPKIQRLRRRTTKIPPVRNRTFLFANRWGSAA
jgi:hypothetical protein